MFTLLWNSTRHVHSTVSLNTTCSHYCETQLTMFILLCDSTQHVLSTVWLNSTCPLNINNQLKILPFEVDPCTVRVEIFLRTHNNIGIQMKRKELTNTFMVVSNWKTLWSPYFIQKKWNIFAVMNRWESSCCMVGVVCTQLIASALDVLFMGDI